MVTVPAWFPLMLPCWSIARCWSAGSLEGGNGESFEPPVVVVACGSEHGIYQLAVSSLPMRAKPCVRWGADHGEIEANRQSSLRSSPTDRAHGKHCIVVTPSAASTLGPDPSHTYATPYVAALSSILNKHTNSSFAMGISSGSPSSCYT